MYKIVLFLLTLTPIESTLPSISNIFFGNGSTEKNFAAPGDYKVYWNVPTFMCHKYGMNFEEVQNDYGIIQNKNDKFRGEKMAIIYDPGSFPAILKSSNGSMYLRNGGVPQEGDLQKHLDLFKIHVNEQLSDNFEGVAVIDFESWRPIYRQNWASLAPYRDLSVSIERKRHPWWSVKSINEMAIRRFEEAGRIFMEETIKTAKLLRPRASWGYYAYPYCFNLTPRQRNWKCDENVKKDNDRISWLWKLEDILFPSVYIRSTLTVNEKKGLIVGRLQESRRIIEKYSLSSVILPYFWYKYRDNSNNFLSEIDVEGVFHVMATNGAAGHVIWGSSNDFTSKQKCEEFRNYLKNILGPAVLQVTTFFAALNDEDKNLLINEQIPLDVTEI
ncbi:hyaluronidase-like [Fopius arisanus]|uniref:Hyaluronidase n=1 Tax=Fopius arisanus TaxID=64838 RepID=A0A9R1TZF6_9HYME|nr:PREDICTED: hyaluronidase-like [Fopius arisanus]XP_011301681.1 PREDICTED: hyaluronidase-like [Fopius arisanus]